jgi:hypothetical protein
MFSTLRNAALAAVLVAGTADFACAQTSLGAGAGATGGAGVSSGTSLGAGGSAAGASTGAGAGGSANIATQPSK